MKLVSDTDTQTFRDDGVVVLRNAFAPEWIETLGAAIDDDLRAPGPTFVNHTTDKDAPAYLEDFWAWNRHAGFRDFVFKSPVADYAARLLGAERINLVMDNWFLREAGSRSRPPFHHDIAYFDFEGRMCVLWLPLEDVTAEEGIAWVKGSHRWGKLFMRRRFQDGHPTDAEDGVTVRGKTYFHPPDVAADPGAYDLARFDMRLGDCVFFDMACLHGGLADTVPTRTIRRYTLRMTAEDGRIAYRGDWAKGEREMFEAEGYGDGDALSGDFFPTLWPRS